MELCQGGTVQDLYQSKYLFLYYFFLLLLKFLSAQQLLTIRCDALVLEGSLNEDQMRWIAYGALESLVYLHSQLHIIHRDLKAANLLLMDDGQVKLSMQIRLNEK